MPSASYGQSAYGSATPYACRTFGKSNTATIYFKTSSPTPKKCSRLWTPFGAYIQVLLTMPSNFSTASGMQPATIPLLRLFQNTQSMRTITALSMWRAFGNQTAPRVALVINVPQFSDVANKANFIFSPVAYF